MAVGIDDRLDRFITVSPKSFRRFGSTGGTEKSVDDDDPIGTDNHRRVCAVKTNRGVNAVRDLNDALLELLLLSVQHPQRGLGLDLCLSVGKASSQREDAE